MSQGLVKNIQFCVTLCNVETQWSLAWQLPPDMIVRS